jgi:hypothetical protein
MPVPEKENFMKAFRGVTSGRAPGRYGGTGPFAPFLLARAAWAGINPGFVTGKPPAARTLNSESL